MKFLSRFIILLITLFIVHTSYFLTQSSFVWAAENFVTDYNVTYTVKEDGITHAEMKVTLTNAANDYSYASSYRVELGFDQLSNITATDLGGIVTPQINKTENGYTIGLDFNKKVVGIGNKQIFTLSFDTPNVAQKQGKIWEINIPGIEDAKAFNIFTVDLKVPASFGQPVYIKPVQNNTSLRFTKDQLAESGISLAFGSEQQYSFTLLYHLQNKNLFPIRTEIAIPPNTNYQQVLIDSIEPEPVSVKKDLDGNWLAEYQLHPAQEIEVKVKGKVNISLYPTKVLLTAEERDRYLQDRPNWQSTNVQIKELGGSLKTPQAIYEYVVENLRYDFSRVTNSSNRLGAVGVLREPDKAVCLEFTDLFIALSRAAGIPAREVDGYAYTEDTRQRPLSLIQDILHAWPEYYDSQKQAWIMVDPTWGNTTGGVDYFHTLDFDHFAFVKKGVSSTYPVPAGGYKVAGEEDRKDVFIWASQENFVKDNELVINSSLAGSYPAGLPIEGKITIVNKGPGISGGEMLYITSDGLSPQTQSINIGELLPYEKKDIVFHFEKLPFLTNKTYPITMSVADKEYRKTIRVMPILIEYWKIIGGAIGIILAFIIFIATVKTRRLRVSRKR